MRFKNKFIVFSPLIFLLLLSSTLFALRQKKQSSLREALFYAKFGSNYVTCQLCPRRCVIPEGGRGFCGVRKNIGGKLYSLVYGKPCAVHIDAIEKKPLFHVLPGSRTFSIATAGCNLRCKFCQNWQISQAKPEEVQSVNLEPAQVVAKTKESNCKSITYTYTEPTIFYEYALETAKIARKEGLKNYMHSAGFINPKPLRELCKHLDAANVDLKGFSEDYYQKLCQGHLEDILRSLKIIKEEGVWLEITNLIIPTLNDDPKLIRKMCVWVRDNLGAETPLHFSRFYPMYKLRNLSPTPISTLEKARKIARDVGLKFVYIGNIPGHQGENTYCPACHKLLIERVGYSILANNLNKGRCKFCRRKIPGIWE